MVNDGLLVGMSQKVTFQASELSKRVIQANKKHTWRGVLATTIATIVSTLATIAIIATRQTYVTTGADHGATLVNSENKIIETGTALSSLALAQLPEQGATGDYTAYEKMRSIRYLSNVDAMRVNATAPRTVVSSAIKSWQWESADRMHFVLADKAVVLIDQGEVAVAQPATGVIAYDGDVAFLASKNAANTSNTQLLSSFTDECAAYSCPKTRCSASVGYVGSTLKLLQLSCGSTPLWSWPSGESLAARASRRRTQFCYKSLYSDGCECYWCDGDIYMNCYCPATTELYGFM